MAYELKAFLQQSMATSGYNQYNSQRSGQVESLYKSALYLTWMTIQTTHLKFKRLAHLSMGEYQDTASH